MRLKIRKFKFIYVYLQKELAINLASQHAHIKNIERKNKTRLHNIIKLSTFYTYTSRRCEKKFQLIELNFFFFIKPKTYFEYERKK